MNAVNSDCETLVELPSILGLSNEVYVHITRGSNIVMVAMVTRENECSTSLAVQLMML